MWRKLTAHRPSPGLALTPRLAWWAAFLTTLALIAILNVVRADAASPSSALAAPPSLADFADEEEEEEPFEEEEEMFGEEAECGEGEEDECLEELEEELPPRECLLSGTDALAAAYPHGRKVRLTVRYSSRTPAQVAISYSLQGPKGALRMGSDRRRFAGTGSFQETEYLSAAQMSRALAAKSFMIEIRPLGAPRYCHVYFDHRLVVKRASPRGPVWLDDETSFRVPGRG